MLKILIVGVEKVGGGLRVSWEILLISDDVSDWECCKERARRVDLMKCIGGEQCTLTESLRVGSLRGRWVGRAVVVREVHAVVVGG
jgi:hypothetical protein